MPSTQFTLALRKSALWQKSASRGQRAHELSYSFTQCEIDDCIIHSKSFSKFWNFIFYISDIRRVSHRMRLIMHERLHIQIILFFTYVEAIIHEVCDVVVYFSIYSIYTKIYLHHIFYHMSLKVEDMGAYFLCSICVSMPYNCYATRE